MYGFRERTLRPVVRSENTKNIAPGAKEKIGKAGISLFSFTGNQHNFAWFNNFILLFRAASKSFAITAGQRELGFFLVRSIWPSKIFTLTGKIRR